MNGRTSPEPILEPELPIVVEGQFIDETIRRFCFIEPRAVRNDENLEILIDCRQGLLIEIPPPLFEHLIADVHKQGH